jgi:hypothetical protein
MGTPVSYCHSAPPPISCSAGYFPGVWHPGHCIEASTCYPVDASWITTKCSNGGVPWRTSTLYEGVLAGETTSTTISSEFLEFPSPPSLRGPDMMKRLMW